MKQQNVVGFSVLLAFLTGSLVVGQTNVSLDGSSVLSILAVCDGSRYAQLLGDKATLVNVNGLSKSSGWCAEADNNATCLTAFEEECRIYATSLGYCRAEQSADECTNGTKGFSGAIAQGICPADGNIPDPAACQTWLESDEMSSWLDNRETEGHKRRYSQQKYKGD